MTSLPRQRIDAREWRRRLLPAVTIALSSLLMTLPLPLGWAVMPNMALLLVLVWSSVQPRLIPVWAAFLLGLWHDLMANMPFGVFALIFPLTVIAVRTAEARLETRSVLVDWAMAALLVFALYLFAWQIVPIAGAPAPLLPLAAQALITALVFPLALAIAAFLHRRLVERWD